jgi:hypothetical protein
MNSGLKSAVEDVLLQGLALLDSVSDDTYTRKEEGPYGASLGAHYRHVLDHFLCLVEGIRGGRINYDRRRRDPLLENSRDAARAATEDLIADFRGLAPEVLEQDCSVIYSVGYGDDGMQAVPSNLAREIMFCVGHAIHHYAILKLLCAGRAVKLPFVFGIAPSTLKHLETRALG